MAPERRVPISVVLLLVGGLCSYSAAGTSPYDEFIRKVSEDIARLKQEYPQLREFSPQKHADIASLRVTYAYHTRRAAHAGGWTSAVPNPDPDGIWFHIDLHDPESTAQIHTQPMTGRHRRVGGKRVSFLVLEGAATKPVAGRIAAILERRGARD
jgi:hypothetical protein